MGEIDSELHTAACGVAVGWVLLGETAEREVDPQRRYRNISDGPHVGGCRQEIDAYVDLGLDGREPRHEALVLGAEAVIPLQGRVGRPRCFVQIDRVDAVHQPENVALPDKIEDPDLFDGD